MTRVIRAKNTLLYTSSFVVSLLTRLLDIGGVPTTWKARLAPLTISTLYHHIIGISQFSIKIYINSTYKPKYRL